MKNIEEYINFFQEEVYNKENVSLPEDAPFFTNLQHLFDMSVREINPTIKFASDIVKYMIDMNLKVNISAEENQNFIFLIFRQIDLEHFFDIMRFAEANGQAFYLSYKYDGCYYGISISKISYEVGKSKVESYTPYIRDENSVVYSASEFSQMVSSSKIEKFSELLESITNDLSHVEFSSLEELEDALHSNHNNMFELQSILRDFEPFEYLAASYLDFVNFLEDIDYTKLRDDNKRSKFVDQLNELFEDFEEWVDTIFNRQEVEDVNYNDNLFKRSFIKIKSFV